MKPVRLYINNFICYEQAFIDFTEFSSALIVGKKENNDMYSNGVGKTTIFKAIEYVLFNQSDYPLERLIRDDTNICQVVFDFYVGDQEYRLSRSRTKKGSTDLTLLQRNSQDGTIEEVYHIIKNYEVPLLDKKITEKYWKDLSGSRAGDTEKDLAKLIKINHKAFISTALFPQNDMAGLASATPEKRKGILKDALNLLIYAKLEKMAKDKYNNLIKDIDKNKLLIDNLGNPNNDLIKLKERLINIELELVEKTNLLIEMNDKKVLYDNKINELININSNLESKFIDTVSKQKQLILNINKIEASVKEYQIKKSNVNKSARELMLEIKSLKELQSNLNKIDYSQIIILMEANEIIKEKITTQNIFIKTNTEKYEDLKIPLPSGSVCKNCRKPMSDKDREEHSNHINIEMNDIKNNIKTAKSLLTELNAEISKNQTIINNLTISKRELEDTNNKIIAANKEIQDKKILHEEYNSLLNNFTEELSNKNKELDLINEDLNKSSIEEASKIKSKIEDEKQSLSIIINKLNILSKEITTYNNDVAIIKHTIDQKNEDISKKEELSKLLLELENKNKIYPSVIQAFSSSGIPNLIIQNVLDDLQIEANNLLSQLKPGLQLSFLIEKTRSDGDQADTLDINYFINGKERYYKQLSGAMQLAVSFSLKLGLSFLLQKMLDVDIKFLLLDEVDQSLDKASVDAFADIVKFFQKDLIILIITHNDRLQGKFNHSILVEQDINMISKARVVSNV